MGARLLRLCIRFAGSKRLHMQAPLTPMMMSDDKWGRHLARHKKGVHMRSSAGRRPTDGRHPQVYMHRGLGEPDVPSSNPVSRLSSHPLEAGSCMHGRCSESGRQERDCADPTLRFPVHCSILPNVAMMGMSCCSGMLRRWGSSQPG